MLWPVTNSTWFTDRPLLHYTNHIKTTIRSWVMHINRPLCCNGERIHHIFPLMDNLPTPKCVIICKLESCGNLLFTSLSLCNYQIGSIKMLRRYFCLVFQRVQKDDPHIEPFTLLCDSWCFVSFQFQISLRTASLFPLRPTWRSVRPCLKPVWMTWSPAAPPQ